MIKKMIMKSRRENIVYGHVLLGKLSVHLVSVHELERNSEKTKTAWPGEWTTGNAIPDENMKMVREFS